MSLGWLYLVFVFEYKLSCYGIVSSRSAMASAFFSQLIKNVECGWRKTRVASWARFSVTSASTPGVWVASSGCPIRRFISGADPCTTETLAACSTCHPFYATASSSCHSSGSGTRRSCGTPVATNGSGTGARVGPLQARSRYRGRTMSSLRY